MFVGSGLLEAKKTNEDKERPLALDVTEGDKTVSLSSSGVAHGPRLSWRATSHLARRALVDEMTFEYYIL